MNAIDLAATGGSFCIEEVTTNLLHTGSLARFCDK